MNIAVFAKRTTFHKGHGGLETQSRALVEGLAKRGHQITLFSPKWELSQPAITENGVDYIFVDCIYRMGPVFGFFGALQKNNWINRSAEEFSLLHSKQEFDLVIGQSSTALGIIRKKEEFDVKIISISHGTIIGEYKSFISSMRFPEDIIPFVKNTGFTGKNFFRRQRDFVHGSDKIICVSNYVKKALIEETFADDNKFVVIHNGIEAGSFADLPANLKRGKKALFVGRVIKAKGVDVIYEIFKNQRFEGLSVDIIGSGEYLEELKKVVADDKNLDSRVNLIGEVPYDRAINKYFKNPVYGVFLLPTKRVEGFPMVLVEALFSGIPIVAYDVGGVSDAVENGKTGYLAQVNDSEAFMTKALDIIKSDDLRNTLSVNCMQKAESEFTLEKMLDCYEKVMKEVLA